MAIDTSNYSIWLSGKPSASPADSDFFFLGSNLRFNHKVEYTGSSLGIMGRGPENAIFVDSTGGAKGIISIDGERVNPLSPYDYPSSYNNISNSMFEKVLTAMKSTTQLTKDAYVLRVYRGLHSTNYREGDHVEFYVFLRSFKITFNTANPLQIGFSVSLFRRNKHKGFQK